MERDERGRFISKSSVSSGSSSNSISSVTDFDLYVKRFLSIVAARHNVSYDVCCNLYKSVTPLYSSDFLNTYASFEHTSFVYSNLFVGSGAYYPFLFTMDSLARDEYIESAKDSINVSSRKVDYYIYCNLMNFYCVFLCNVFKMKRAVDVSSSFETDHFNHAKEDLLHLLDSDYVCEIPPFVFPTSSLSFPFSALPLLTFEKRREFYGVNIDDTVVYAVYKLSSVLNLYAVKRYYPVFPSFDSYVLVGDVFVEKS